MKKRIKSKSLKTVLLTLWTLISVLVSGVLSSWLYDSLRSIPSSFLIQSLRSFLGIQLTIFQLLITVILLSIPFILLSHKQHSNLVRKIEKELTEFIFDVFKSHLDEDLVHLITDAIEERDKVNEPLVQCILEKLIAYFKDDLSLIGITVFVPSTKQIDHIEIAYAMPHLSNYILEKLTCYVGPQAATNHEYKKRGLAGAVYVSKEIKKIVHRREREKSDGKFCMVNKAYIIKQDGQISLEPFLDYIDLQTGELIGVKSTVAVPLSKEKVYDRQGGTLEEKEILGVMCIDSSSEDTFKSLEYDERLSQVSQCLSVSIEIQRLFEDLH